MRVSRLCDFAWALGVKVDYFFEGLDTPPKGESCAFWAVVPADIWNQSETWELARSVAKLPKHAREALVEFARGLAEEESGAEKKQAP